jgi:hypothetical protein
MPTLQTALSAAPAAELTRGTLRTRVAQDLDGTCAVMVFAPPHAAVVRQRLSTLAEVRAYLASGAVPGVRGDEPDWAPVD